MKMYFFTEIKLLNDFFKGSVIFKLRTLGITVYFIYHVY